MLEYYMLVALCAVVVFELFCIWKRLSKKLDVASLKNLPPGTMGFPLIGETLQFAKKKFDFFREKHEQYGPIFKTHLLGKPVVRVFGAENIRKIIQGENKIVQSCYPSSLKKLIGEKSLTQSSGEYHKSRKIQLMKFLCPEFLQNHIPMFQETIYNRILKWQEQPSVDIHRESCRLFIELASKYLVKMDIDEETILEISRQHDIFTRNLFVMPVYFPGFGFYKAVKAKERLREIFKTVLKNGDKKPDELSSVLERLYASMDGQAEAAKEETLMNTIIELMWSGAETISSAGFSLLYLLSKNPDCVQRLRQELSEHDLLNNNTGAICQDDLKHLHYVDAFIKETLRYLPPVGGAYRKVVKPLDLEGYTVPKNWLIAFGIRDTHYNDKATEDPSSFCPERWLNRCGSELSFLTFGGGARICPGQAYAKTLLKIFTVELVRNCELNIVEDGGITLFPTPRPDKPISVQFRQSVL